MEIQKLDTNALDFYMLLVFVANRSICSKQMETIFGEDDGALMYSRYNELYRGDFLKFYNSLCNIDRWKMHRFLNEQSAILNKRIDDENNEEVKVVEDVKLLDVLSCRGRDLINKHNLICTMEEGYSWLTERDVIVYASDAANYIQRMGDKNIFLKERHFGRKSNDELLSFIQPFIDCKYYKCKCGRIYADKLTKDGCCPYCGDTLEAGTPLLDNQANGELMDDGFISVLDKLPDEDVMVQVRFCIGSIITRYCVEPSYLERCGKFRGERYGKRALHWKPREEKKCFGIADIW